MVSTCVSSSSRHQLRPPKPSRIRQVRFC
jgi:hypothetical protein